MIIINLCVYIDIDIGTGQLGVRGTGRVMVVPLQPPWMPVIGFDRTVEFILPADFDFEGLYPGFVLKP